jgi:NADH:ubiquinone oxidoreductase subunit E
MKVKDKVKTHLSLCKGEIGTVTGMIEIQDKAEHWVHVIFPETDKHYAFQQSFNSKDLIIVIVEK